MLTDKKLNTKNFGSKLISRKNVSYFFIVALERLKIERISGVGQISHPLDDLPTSDKPDIVEGQNCVQEALEALHVLRLCEPSCMIKESNRCPAKMVHEISK